MRAKLIRQLEKPYLFRMTIPLGERSIKIHLFLADDTFIEHSHPWRFVSFLLTPYAEFVGGKHIWHLPFEIVYRDRLMTHRVVLYRLFGMPIPALTIGFYGKKRQLCSMCQSFGVCLSKRGFPKEAENKLKR